MSGAENINRKNYCDGMRDAIPIALGYLAVAFTLGIAARNAGVHVLPATRGYGLGGEGVPRRDLPINR